jgi:hypothetical protein
MIISEEGTSVLGLIPQAAEASLGPHSKVSPIRSRFIGGSHYL